MDQFEQFWAIYPNKSAKKRARDRWARLRPDAALIATILAAVVAQVAWRRRLAARREWAPEWPHAATWLQGERWADETGEAPAFAAPVSQAGADPEVVARIKRIQAQKLADAEAWLSEQREQLARRRMQ